MTQGASSGPIYFSKPFDILGVSMNVELRPLRQFVAVAEELHFGRAAQRLHMTQPPLTQAIQALEATLGLRLFERTRRSVALTPAGAALLEHARRLLSAADELPRLVQAAALGFSGLLRLAFVSSIAYGPLPAWLRSFREAHPEVQLQLREATLDVQLEAFEADEIDAGFVLHAPGAAPAGHAALTVLHEPLVLALSEAHPLARKRSLALPEVLAEAVVIFPRPISPSLFDAVLSFYRAHGVAPRIAQEAIQMQTIVNLVSVGMGVAWVPRSVTQLQRPGVVYREPRGVDLASETSLLWREPALPVVQRFVAHVRKRPRAR
jgi:DNA-binding transcriptional LysR family regulator